MSNGTPARLGAPMDLWQYLTLFFAVCLVSGAVAYAAAHLRFSNLAWRVAEMESAVEHYWDRIRKRTRVEPYEPPAAKAPSRGIIALPAEKRVV